jgi:hypothetical protein
MITWDEPGCLGNIGRVVLLKGIHGEDEQGRFCWIIQPEYCAADDYCYLLDEEERVCVWTPAEGSLYHPAGWLMPLPPDEADGAEGGARRPEVSSLNRVIAGSFGMTSRGQFQVIKEAVNEA